MYCRHFVSSDFHSIKLLGIGSKYYVQLSFSESSNHVPPAHGQSWVYSNNPDLNCSIIHTCSRDALLNETFISSRGCEKWCRSSVDDLGGLRQAWTLKKSKREGALSTHGRLHENFCHVQQHNNLRSSCNWEESRRLSIYTNIRFGYEGNLMKPRLSFRLWRTFIAS